jgi:iron-sulfur cluster assembly accessory protein
MVQLISIGRKNDKLAVETAEPAMEVASDALGITGAAARMILEKLALEGKREGVFRVGIMGGGCSGLTYLFRVEDAAKERDRVFEREGARVVVDPKSLGHLGGTVLDWREELGKSGFEVRNPHVKSSCSCGSSFTL